MGVDQVLNNSSTPIFVSLSILLNDSSLITDNPESFRCFSLPKAILTSF